MIESRCTLSIPKWHNLFANGISAFSFSYGGPTHHDTILTISNPEFHFENMKSSSSLNGWDDDTKSMMAQGISWMGPSNGGWSVHALAYQHANLSPIVNHDDESKEKKDSNFYLIAT